MLMGAELNQLLTLVVAVTLLETPCEPEMLLVTVMNDHLHPAGLLGPLRSGQSTPKKIWKAVRILLSAMNEIEELVAVRLGAKTKVVFTSSPWYASLLLALQFVCAVLELIAEGSGLRMLMAAPNRELRLSRSEVAAAWADLSHACEVLTSLWMS